MGPRASLDGFGEQKTYTNLTTKYLHVVFVFIIRNCYMFRPGQVAISAVLYTSTEPVTP